MRHVRQVFAAGHNIFTHTDVCSRGLRASESMQGRLAPLELQGLRGRPETMAQTGVWACQAHQERLACKAVPSQIPHPPLLPLSVGRMDDFMELLEGGTGDGTLPWSRRLMPIALQGFLERLAHQDHPAHLVRSLPFKDHTRCFLAGTSTCHCQSHSLRCRYSKHWGPRHARDSRHPRGSRG